MIFMLSFSSSEHQGAPRSTAAILADQQRPKSSKKLSAASAERRSSLARKCVSPAAPRNASNTNNNASLTSSLRVLPPLSPTWDEARDDVTRADDVEAVDEGAESNVDSKLVKLGKTMYAQCDLVAKEFDSSGCKLPDLRDAGGAAGQLMVGRGQAIHVQRFFIEDDLCYGYIVTESAQRRWGCFPINKVSLLQPSK